MSPFRAIVHLDDKGEILCFCPYDEYLRGQCVCRDKYDCPEAMIEVTVLPKSRPSDKSVQSAERAAKNLKKANQEVKKANDRIKQGVDRLEKALRGSRFKI